MPFQVLSARCLSSKHYRVVQHDLITEHLASQKASSSLDCELVVKSYDCFARLNAASTAKHSSKLRILTGLAVHSHCLLSAIENRFASQLPYFHHPPQHRSGDRSPSRTSSCDSFVILAFLILYIQTIPQI